MSNHTLFVEGSYIYECYVCHSSRPPEKLCIRCLSLSSNLSTFPDPFFLSIPITVSLSLVSSDVNELSPSN